MPLWTSIARVAAEHMPTRLPELTPDVYQTAARRVMAFSDDLIRAAVQTGQYSDPVAAAHLASVLRQRRDAIADTAIEDDAALRRDVVAQDDVG